MPTLIDQIRIIPVAIYTVSTYSSGLRKYAFGLPAYKTEFELSTVAKHFSLLIQYQCASLVNVHSPTFHRFWNELRKGHQVNLGQRIIDSRVILHYSQIFRRFGPDVVGLVQGIRMRINRDFRFVRAR